MSLEEEHIADQMRNLVSEIDICLNFVIANPKHSKFYAKRAKVNLRQFLALELKQLDMAIKRTEREVKMNVMCGTKV